MKKLNFKQLYEKFILTEDDDLDALGNIAADDLNSIDASQDEPDDLQSIDTNADPKKQDWCGLMKAAAEKNWGKDKWLRVAYANEAFGKDKPIIPGLTLEKTTAFDVFKIYAYISYDNNKEKAEKLINVGTAFMEDAYDTGDFTNKNRILTNVRLILDKGCDLNSKTYGNSSNKLGIASYINSEIAGSNIMLCKDLYKQDPTDIYKYCAYQREVLRSKADINLQLKDKDPIKCIFYLGGNAENGGIEATNLSTLRSLADVQHDVAEVLNLEISNAVKNKATANDLIAIADEFKSNPRKYGNQAVINTVLQARYLALNGSKEDNFKAKNYPTATATPDNIIAINNLLNNSQVDFSSASTVLNLAGQLNNDDNNSKNTNGNAKKQQPTT